jgi:hypothetical protein
MRAISLLVGDQFTPNDTITGTLNILMVIPVSALPYEETFEDTSPEGNQTAGLSWFTGLIPYRPLNQGSVPSEPPAPEPINDWVRGTPAKTQISGAHRGTKCYVTKLTGNYTDQTETFLHSPSFDFTALTGDIIVEFWQNMKTEVSWDGGALEISTNGGSTWRRVDSTLGTGNFLITTNSVSWYNNNDTLGYYDRMKWSSSDRDSIGEIPIPAGWFKSATRISGLAGRSDVRFRFHFSSDDAIADEGWAIDDFMVSRASTVNPFIVAGWNMVANPVTRAANTDSVRLLYPESSFPYAFRFLPGTGYTQSYTMPNGPGFWEKFPGADINPISGTALNSFSVPVSAGWNMVGSITIPVDTGTITSTPSGIRASNWFGYLGGYSAVSQIVPGKAYWIKASQGGTFLFDTPDGATPADKGQEVSVVEGMNELRIRDSEGGEQVLYFGVDGNDAIPMWMYEMPPVPPEGAFDARFSSEQGGMMLRKHGEEIGDAEFPILIQTSAYPVTVSWKMKGTSGQKWEYTLSDGEGRESFTPVVLKGEGVAKVGSTGRIVLRGTGGGVQPTDYALWQNYPNPFNPSTNIRFALPVEGRVTIEVFNILGQRVRTLMDESRGAGQYVVEWNGRGNGGQQLGSGVYMLRLTAAGTDGSRFKEVRKLMLLK